MTITFENDSDIIVYPLEPTISYARKSQFIFVAQCVLWLSSTIGLQQGLVTHIDDFRIRPNIGNQEVSTTPRYVEEDQTINKNRSEENDCSGIS